MMVPARLMKMCIRDSVGVVGGGDFHHTGAEVHLHVLVGHNGDFLVHHLCPGAKSKK